MSFPYQTISSNNQSLNSASFYSQKDLDIFLSGSEADSYFGKSELDSIEFSVFDIEGNTNVWKYIENVGVYNTISRNYFDVDNNRQSYTYKIYNSSYKKSFNNKLLLNLLNDLTSSNITNGNHVISYNFVRDVAGNNKDRLYIKEISQDRKEIKLIPSFTKDIDDEKNLLINTSFECFAKKQVIVKDIVPYLENILERFQLSLQPIDEEIVTTLKTNFGFSNDNQVFEFLNETYNGFKKPYVNSINNSVLVNVYDGIKNYIKNWCYTYYNQSYSFNSIRNEFRLIVSKSVTNRLLALNFYYQNNTELKVKIESYTNDIFFKNFIDLYLSTIESQYNNKFYGYLKNSINFGNNEFYEILNYDYTNEENGISIVVKLFEELPLSIGTKSSCWISNISVKPVIQKVVINSVVTVKKYKISGPNFNVSTKNIKSNSINYQNKQSLQINQDITLYKKLNELNVDYGSFSNFIVFGSAELRTKLFVNKLNKLNRITQEINKITNLANSSSVEISASYKNDLILYKNQSNEVIESFDGYDTYLYKNQNIITNDYLQTAIEYDRNNKDSLVNNTPEYIVNDSENIDYLMFLSMVGHHFDNLYTYINNFPIKQYTNNFDSSSYLNTFTNNLLESFGWNSVGDLDNVDATKSYSTSSNYSIIADKQKIIWGRILNALPYIYKSKGTEECVNIFKNIYGVPTELVQIDEYGGPYNIEDNASTYTYKKDYYLTKYTNGSEIVDIPVQLSSNDPFILSYEFVIRFDTNKTYSVGRKCPFMQKGNDWLVYFIKSKSSKLGKIGLEFISGEYIETDDIPIFDGGLYNILIKYDVTSSQKITLDNISSGFFGENYPLTITVVKIDGENFAKVITTKKIFADFDLLFLNFANSSTPFRIGNYNLFASGWSRPANYFLMNQFYGNIDKINLWNINISDDLFLQHCKNLDAYNSTNMETTYEDLYFRYSFEYPIDLYSPFLSSSVKNDSKYNKNINALAYFFPQTDVITNNTCATYSSSLFPYQFDVVNLNKTFESNFYGPNKLKNLKINKLQEFVDARLSVYNNSTYTNVQFTDSNIISVAIKPYQYRNEDILNFFGNINLMEYIGDPKFLYKNRYDELFNLREIYNKYNLSEKVLLQEFLTLYNYYVDPSFFENIKQILPYRAKIIDGILIEPGLLERNKYQSKEIISTLINFPDNTFNPIKRLNYDFEYNQLSNIKVKLSVHGYESIYGTRNFEKYIYNCDSNIEKRLSTFVTNECVYYNDDHFRVYKIESNKIIEGNKTNGENSNYIKTYNSYWFVPKETILDNTYTLDNEKYPVSHLSLKRNNNTRFSINQYSGKSLVTTVFKKSQSKKETTVDQKGITNDSLPVEVTAVNKEVSEPKLINNL